jgi:hypothetical protein
MSSSVFPVPFSGVQETLIDAKGDLIAGNAADTPVRVPVGSNNTVLTADSSVTGGIKWAAPTSPTGVGVSLNGATQLISSGATLTVAWNQEFYDTDGFHDNSTNNSRITIPAGKGGKYLVGANIMWQDAANNTRIVQLWKNGVDTGSRLGFLCASIGNTYYYSMSGMWALTLAAGDYLQITAQNMDSSAKYLYGTGSPGLGDAALSFHANYLGA